MSEPAVAINMSHTRTVYYKGGNASIPPRLSVTVDPADVSELLSLGFDFLHIEHPDLLSTLDVEDPDCPLSAENLAELRKAGIHTADELKAATDAELEAIPTIGKATVQHIREWLAPEQG